VRRIGPNDEYFVDVNLDIVMETAHSRLVLGTMKPESPLHEPTVPERWEKVFGGTRATVET